MTSETDERTWSTRTLFAELLGHRSVGMVFQPIVDLDDGDVVGFEALARGPAGSALESPAALMAEAGRTGQLHELDWLCRATAVREFMAASLPETVALFINAEPAAIGTVCPEDLLPTFDQARSVGFPVVVELTERSVAKDPAGLLKAVQDLRRHPVCVALDDVGTDAAALAMMPLIHPDIIKLDLSLIQEQTTPAVARVVAAVLAEAERSGAVIVAEGIESAHHESVARSLGATLGQGWFYGRPAPLPARVPAPHQMIRQRSSPELTARTPFEVVAGRRLSRAPERLLVPMSVHLESRVLGHDDPAVVLACFQNSSRFNAATRTRYAHLASRSGLVAVLGRDMPGEPAPGIRGARLSVDDPIVNEWCVVVLGPDFAGALLARQRPESDQVGRREFDFAITHDRDLVVAAAVPIVTRLLAEDGQAN